MTSSLLELDLRHSLIYSLVVPLILGILHKIFYHGLELLLVSVETQTVLLPEDRYHQILSIVVYIGVDSRAWFLFSLNARQSQLFREFR